MCDRRPIAGGGEEQRGQSVRRSGGPEVARVRLVHGGGHEVPGQAAGSGEIAGVGEDVPPHRLGRVGDLLRIERPHHAGVRAGRERGGVGVAGRLVGGQQHRSGRAQDRGDRQTGGLTGPGRHDRQDHVLPRGADLARAGRERAEQNTAVVGYDVLGLGALEARTEIDRLGRDLLGHQSARSRWSASPLGLPRSRSHTFAPRRAAARRTSVGRT